MEPSIQTVAVPCALCGNPDGLAVARGWDFEYGTSRTEFTVRQCPECSHEYLSPRPLVAELSRIYPPDYYAYDMQESHDGVVLRVKRALEGRRIRRFLKLVSASPPRCLDVGCGDGAFLDLLHSCGVPKNHLTGIDLSEALIGRLRARGIAGYVGRIEDLAPPEHGYDLILMLQTIEHVEDPVAVLAAVSRLLAPGGIFVCETPNVRSLDALLFRHRYWSGYHFPRHWHLFHEATLSALGKGAGLDLVRIQTYPCVVSWIFPIHHWLRDHGMPRGVYRLFWPFRNLPLLALFTVVDGLLAPFGLTSNLRGIFRRPE